MDVFHARGIEFPDEDGFLIERRFGEHDSEGITKKAAAPEFESRAVGLLAADVAGLVADAVHHRHVDAIRDGVRALDGTPRVVLLLAVLLLLVRMPADRRGIEQHLRALQRGKPRGFGIPLVPADERTDFADRRIQRLEAEVARREIELFVVERIVGDVHLAIQPAYRAALVEHDRGVVIHTGCAPLEN